MGSLGHTGARLERRGRRAPAKDKGFGEEDRRIGVQTVRCTREEVHDDSRAQRGKKAAPRATWRNRQLQPTPDRYKTIQDALAAKGYMKAEDATGKWDQGSMDALKKFQEDQKSNPRARSIRCR